MEIVVQKFGGSSVADVEKIRRVALKVKARAAAGSQVVVVVSAMGDTTDELLTLAKKVSVDPPRRELDMLLTCGERISMALLSMALQEEGVNSISFTGSQSGIITDDSHSQARIVEVRPVRILEELGKGKVVIVAGYQGVSLKREVTTLGRGGSDTTAVALAAALGADCEIYSDVDGVFTADPRKIPDAQKLDALSYDEMQELASAGAKVLNAQAVEFAREKGIVIRALSTHTSGTGTQIEGTPRGSSRVKGVSVDEDVLVLSCVGQPHPFLSWLGKEGIKPRMVFYEHSHLQGRVFVVAPLQDVHGLSSFLAKLTSLFGNTVTTHDELGAVSMIGAGIGSDMALVAEALKVADEIAFALSGLHCTALQMTALGPRTQLSELSRRWHERFIVEGDQRLRVRL